ncbi:uncharacterized protein B0I36DRAFT_324839 [Microdochium trichocladiopsis]|uniref:Uncharacterized protein n=1 Tax=Microdochium trichocladiopsis TaxID=1682393 RepID=A0A9P9BLW1_9PEZI|nr:uncharacterized protein B0I36DRAFT_324839 [Microdochium trichocladiopsis]KAH7029003.1 hypothetical protein B0I36DRAFT_324839 [Microdochium trichocladiopsis]
MAVTTAVMPSASVMAASTAVTHTSAIVGNACARGRNRSVHHGVHYSTSICSCCSRGAIVLPARLLHRPRGIIWMELVLGLSWGTRSQPGCL